VVAKDGRLHGAALFVLDSADADVIVVCDASGRLHLVSTDTAGVELDHLATIDKTRSVGELKLTEAVADILPQSGIESTRRIIDAGRIVLAADTLGAAAAMIERSVAYARERVQFGRPIGAFQAVKHMCAEMAASLEPCRSLVWYAAHAFDAAPEESGLMACYAKSHLSEVGRFVARTATEVHGGMGFTDLCGLHYWFKRIGLDRQLLGGPERVRHEAARLQGWVSA
jgi:alkylation response protein AidB-like acyl-CoA dehydrogenase